MENSMEKIGEILITDNKKLVLSIGEYRGEERIDIRTYVLTEKGWIITAKGINMHSEYLEAFVELVMKLNEKYELG